jgi:hypothetical protein
MRQQISGENRRCVFEASGQGDESCVGNHPVLGSRTEVLDMPKPQKVFHSLNAGKSSMFLQ